MKTGLTKIQGIVRDYDWGGFSYIPALIGDVDPTPRPSAEYWLGVHPSAPAKVLPVGDEASNLIQWQAAVGDAPLPFLMKLLDVRQMLSIQVHPSIPQAEAGFERENASGIPLDAPGRTYKDRNHKPELAYALGEFWMLHGLRSESDLRSDLERRPSCAPLLDILDSDGIAGLVGASLDEANPVIRAVTNDLIAEVQSDSAAQSKHNHGFWVKRWMDSNPGVDRGLLMILFMNLVELKAGEAIYQPQGLIHAYLEGRNVEIMANSDNVLRAGLTSKHIDAGELLRVSLLDPSDPAQFKVMVKRDQNGLRSFDTPYDDFLLRDIEIAPSSEQQLVCERSQIMLFFSGEQVTVSDSENSLVLNQGEACFCTKGTQLILKNESQCTAHLFIGS